MKNRLGLSCFKVYKNKVYFSRYESWMNRKHLWEVQQINTCGKVQVKLVQG